MKNFLPVDPLIENSHWLAIHHPQPDYPLHILILSKQGIAAIEDIPGDNLDLNKDFLKIVTSLISQFDLNNRGYRLVMNGGPNQLVPLLHWHLVSDQGRDSRA